jgi:hypothetical protein
MLFGFMSVLNAIVYGMASERRSSLMTMQSDDRSRILANNLWAQFGLATAVAVIVIILASRYVW